MKGKTTIVVLSFLLLGAHFLREGSTIATLLCVIAPLLLFIKKYWALRTVQTLLLGGVLVWLETLISLINLRFGLGIPWIRMAVILGAVTLVTAYGAFVLNATAFKDSYR